MFYIIKYKIDFPRNMFSSLVSQFYENSQNQVE